MSETDERGPDPSPDEEAVPTDKELDVEGPNESGPGHHPEGEEASASPRSGE
jgi:hypothetical protein